MMTQQLPFWLKHSARLTRLQGSMVQAPLLRSFIGECCLITQRPGDMQTAVAQAQAIGFSDEGVILSLLGDNHGLSSDLWVTPTGSGPQVLIDDHTLGAVLDGQGTIVTRLLDAPIQPDPSDYFIRNIDATPPPLAARRPVSHVFTTGIRAIDGLLTCGVGQRVGIFAGAGVGKSAFISMLLAHANADIFIIGLVGERGREAAEFMAHAVPANVRHKTIVVCSTSDRPAAERRNAAHMATAIAEHYRDRGLQVVLILDSLTRYARSLRDLALSAGAPPARRGYPAVVLESLPRLLERAGVIDSGSITAFYTVLLEDEEQGDPIGDEVRSIVDGHIYLSSSLAQRGHYPAIDVLKSRSRVMNALVTREHVNAAEAMRRKLARLDDLQLAIDLGEYRPGVDSEVDALIQAKTHIDAWLRQDIQEGSAMQTTLQGLYALS